MDEKQFTEIEWEKSRKFKRRWMYISRVLALLLIISIFWIGFVQMRYAKEFNELKSEHGPNAFCYMCGLESFKRCECIYMDQQQWALTDLDVYRQGLADENSLKCKEIKSLSGSLINLSGYNLSV